MDKKEIEQVTRIAVDEAKAVIAAKQKQIFTVGGFILLVLGVFGWTTKEAVKEVRKDADATADRLATLLKEGQALLPLLPTPETIKQIASAIANLGPAEAASYDEWVSNVYYGQLDCLQFLGDIHLGDRSILPKVIAHLKNLAKIAEEYLGTSGAKSRKWKGQLGDVAPKANAVIAGLEVSIK